MLSPEEFARGRMSASYSWGDKPDRVTRRAIKRASRFWARKRQELDDDHDIPDYELEFDWVSWYRWSRETVDQSHWWVAYHSTVYSYNQPGLRVPLAPILIEACK